MRVPPLLKKSPSNLGGGVASNRAWRRLFCFGYSVTKLKVCSMTPKGGMSAIFFSMMIFLLILPGDTARKKLCMKSDRKSR